MINSAEEAEALVRACKYPPRGARSNGPVRAGFRGPGGAYQATANEQTLCLPMIETRAAVENMESILDVDGIAGVYVGPSDLGFSYGLTPKLDRDEPEIIEIYRKLLRECEQRGLYAGIHCSGPAGAKRAIDLGFKLVTLLSDIGMMASAARQWVGETRGAAGSER